MTSEIPERTAGMRTSFRKLVGQLRTLIQAARQQALRSVDLVQVRTCWEVGRHIVEFEQGGATRAAYGQGLLDRLAERLTVEFGRGFDASNLYKMSQFYRSFSKLDALRPELSWTHYRLLLRVDDAAARNWYMTEAAAQNWSTRVTQIGSSAMCEEEVGAECHETQEQSRVVARLTAPGAFRAGLWRAILAKY